ncbi:MAG: AgmX/PglI C-terminal domain-containing protein [Deltaproteobacteria bacterium]
MSKTALGGCPALALLLLLALEVGCAGATTPSSAVASQRVSEITANRSPAAVRAQGERPTRGAGLAPNQIPPVLRASSAALDACFASSTAAAAGIAGQIRVAWTIGADGAVSEASLVSSDFSDRQIADCILDEIRRLRFPRAGEPTSISFPFELRP